MFRVLLTTLVCWLLLLPSTPAGAAHLSEGGKTIRPPALAVLGYPRLASIYGLLSPNQAPTFERYGLIIANRQAGPSGAVRAVKAANPSSKIVLYADTSSVDLPGFDGLDIYPGWWLTLAGTRLSADIDSITTTIPVENAAIIAQFLATNPDLLVDGETVHVTAVDTAHNTLTVQRGYLSTSSPHTAGARIAAHATKWPNTWMLNITPYCPVDPATGQTWVQYAAEQVKAAMASAPWDGVLWDDGNISFAHLSQGQLDANNDNIADAGNGPSGTGWQDGAVQLLARNRALLAGKLLLVTDAYYPGLTDGQEMEHFPFYADGWANAFTTYTTLAGPSSIAPYTIVNADTANSGIQDLRQMRFDLATALMGNGYFSYDFGPNVHGQTWWYDEYDEGAGSSLAGAITASQTTLQVAPGTGGRFQVGDVVHVPEDIGVAKVAGALDDEQMLVTAVRGDILSIERGYSHSLAAAHPARTKVFTQAQVLSGLGWLGQPLGPARADPLLGATQLLNVDFERAPPAWLAPWKLDVQGKAAASISQDTTTHAGGWASARIKVRTASPDKPWYVALVQQNQPGQTALHLEAGKTYTLSFWAKGDAGQSMWASVQQSIAPWAGRAYQSYSLTRQWQRYTLTFVAPATESAVQVQFNLGESAGTIWLDRVRFQQGDPNLWRRDFTGGTVLLNATNSARTVFLGPGYRRIAGTQDPAVNNGAGATSVTIAPHDGILLVKTH